MNTQATHIMTPRPAVVTPDDAITDAAALMRDRDVGALPVVHDLGSLRLVGIITDRDIAIRCTGAHHGAPGAVRTHMSWGPMITAAVDTPIEEIARRMRVAGVRRIPIVDRGDRVVGIVALADLARHWAGDHPREVLDVLESVCGPTPTTANA